MEIWNTDDYAGAAAHVHPLLRSCKTGRLIVLANREPIAHERTSDGRILVERSTSGLVTASEAVVRAYGGVWVAHGSGSADRDVVDDADGVLVPDDAPEYRLRRVWLDAAEQRGYYYGFANEGLWPLCHRIHVRPEFRSSDFDMYWTINERFVDAVAQEAGEEPALVLVQDYTMRSPTPLEAGASGSRWATSTSVTTGSTVGRRPTSRRVGTTSAATPRPTARASTARSAR